MTTQNSHRWRELALAIAVTLAAAACSKAPSSAPTSTQAPPAASAANEAAAPATDHSKMDMGDSKQAMDPNAPMAEATADAAGSFGSGKPVTVTLHVSDMMSGKPMDADSFSIVHTEKLHVLGVDPSLTDYSHSHPAPEAKAGDWQFSFTPKFNRPYHLWLDVTPLRGAHQYVMVTLNGGAATVPVEKTPALTAASGDIQATLSFDAPLRVGEASMGHIAIHRGGKPFAALEPLMGAYGHIVGISEDWATIAHVHPMGTEPTSPGDRGGPALDFHLEPKHAGFLKLFAQVRVDGHDVFLPFGANVAEAAAH